MNFYEIIISSDPKSKRCLRILTLLLFPQREAVEKPLKTRTLDAKRKMRVLYIPNDRENNKYNLLNSKQILTANNFSSLPL